MGAVYTDSQSMLRLCTRFYSQLFEGSREDDECIDTLLQGAELPKVSEDHVDSLARDITVVELKQALWSMSARKAPGVDGLGPRFYKQHWNIVAAPLLESFRHSFTVGHLSMSQSRAAITLLPKKGDLTSLRNWRPISLLCCDYKILASALARRLKAVVPTLIHADQTGFVAGRFIGTNVVRMRDTMDVCNEEARDGCFLALDQEKAYDRVSWHYFRCVLTAFGFPTAFMRMVSCIYSGVSSHVLLNGWLSDEIRHGRGFRQGCALSPFFYNLSLEPLLCLIRRDERITPILPFGNIECAFRVSAYADDTVIGVGDEASLEHVFTHIRCYCDASNAQINWSKCAAITTNSWTHFNFLRESKIPIVARGDNVDILGVPFGTSSDYREKWNGLIDRLNNTLARWHNVAVSFAGRARIARAAGVSKALYLAQLCACPAEIITKITRLVSSFIWKGRQHRVAYQLLCKPEARGGIGAPNVSATISALLASWVRRLLMSPHSNWSILATMRINASMKQHGLPSLSLFSCKTLAHQLTATLPPFWKAVARNWFVCGGGSLEPPTNACEVRAMRLWHNAAIVDVRGRPMRWRRWIHAKIITVNDLMTDFENEDVLRLISIHGNIVTDRFGFVTLPVAKILVGRSANKLMDLIHAIPQAWKDLLIQDLPLQPQEFVYSNNAVGRINCVIYDTGDCVIDTHAIVDNVHLVNIDEYLLCNVSDVRRYSTLAVGPSATPRHIPLGPTRCLYVDVNRLRVGRDELPVLCCSTRDFASMHRSHDDAPLRMIATWTTLFNSAVDTNQLVKCRRNPQTRVKWSDLQWRLFCHALPTLARVQRHTAVDATCKFCGAAEETDVHLFWECSHARAVWTLFVCRASRLLDRHITISLESVVMGDPFSHNGDWKNVPRLEKDTVRALLALTRWCLWVARCKSVYDNANFRSVNALIALWENLVDAESFARALCPTIPFARSWGVRGVLASIRRPQSTRLRDEDTLLA
jgi:hypothetical protein